MVEDGICSFFELLLLVQLLMALIDTCATGLQAVVPLRILASFFEIRPAPSF